MQKKKRHSTSAKYTEMARRLQLHEQSTDFNTAQQISKEVPTMGRRIASIIQSNRNCAQC